MICLDARRALGAEPGRRTPELEAHLAGCAACARYASELLEFDRRILRALQVPVPAPSPARESPQPQRAAPRRPAARWLALAASVVGAAVLVFGLWSAAPREALATALVGHLDHEPKSWARTDVRVPEAALGYVLGRAGIELAPGAPAVTYAQSCSFRGYHVPHLVVQTDAGPMTVMVLTHEHVTAPTRIDEGGYRGVIVPAARGSFAVLSRGPVDAATLDAVVARVAAAVRFRG